MFDERRYSRSLQCASQSSACAIASTSQGCFVILEAKGLPPLEGFPSIRACPTGVSGTAGERESAIWQASQHRSWPRASNQATTCRNRRGRGCLNEKPAAEYGGSESGAVRSQLGASTALTLIASGCTRCGGRLKTQLSRVINGLSTNRAKVDRCRTRANATLAGDRACRFEPACGK